jgi:hypothetical protein
MLPLPVIKFFPKLYRSDPLAIKTANKVESDITTWKGLIDRVKRHFRPDECPDVLVNELSYFLEADTLPGDSIQTRRIKVYNAVRNHKKRGLFQDDVKIKIDAITMLSPGSRIIRSTGTGDWIIVGDGTTPTDFYWAVLGVDGIDDDYGLDLIGDGTENEISGNIYIDCHEGVTTPVLTADEIESIKLTIDDSVAAYFRVRLGYIDGTGAFVTYPDGVIG